MFVATKMILVAAPASDKVPPVYVVLWLWMLEVTYWWCYATSLMLQQ